MTALAFDFGLGRIGVAVAEREPPFARGVATVYATDGAPRWPALDALIDTWRPEALVVGLPINMDGTPSAMSDRAQRFGDSLAARYGTRVEYVDERLSTFEARARGATPDDSHATAAQVIAETWLATRPEEHQRHAR